MYVSFFAGINIQNAMIDDFNLILTTFTDDFSERINTVRK